MKRAFILFWKGLTRFLTAIAEWFTVILGMKDDSMYGKILRRTVGTCFTLMVLFVTSAAVAAFFEGIVGTFCNDSEELYDTQYLSRNTTYYVADGKDGYIENENGKKTIKGISWIAKPLGDDSLVCYSNGRKRGYFNIYSGKTVIKPQYAHAWIFSEGLASVDDNGWIKFIDGTGKVVIDLKMPYIPGIEGYVFHNQHCAVHNDRRDRWGLINKQGQWVLNAEYFSIEPCDTFWILDNGKEQSMITDNMQTIIPFSAGSVRISLRDQTIIATMSDHTVKTFNLQGDLIEDFCIQNIEMMTYDTGELYSAESSEDEYSGYESTPMQAVAKCKRYEAEYGWYGLMTPEGKILTPPAYSSIEAIGADLYFCQNDNGNGILLNGKGEKVDEKKGDRL